MMLTTLWRGLRMLRHPELVRRLGDLHAAEREVEALRSRNRGARISSDARIEGWRGGTISLADGAQVEYGTTLALGDPYNGFGSLTVGAQTWIGPYNNLRLAGGTSIVIGSGCLIAQFCSIIASNHDISTRQPIRETPAILPRRNVTIGDDVWLGAGSIVLPGVTIGDGAVIAAGAIVTRSVAAYEIWAGNPARKVGERPA